MTNILPENGSVKLPVPDPSQFEPFIERLMAPAAGHGGKFIVYGIRENPETNKGQIKVEHVLNSGEPVFIAAALASAVRRICAIPNMNCYINACLMRADLPEKQRGKKADVIGVLAIPLDFDRQHSPATRAARLPFDPHVEVETSPGNFQVWPYLDHPYSLAEAEAVAAVLGTLVGVDATASGEHGYRVPGTLNYPNSKKREKGRPPEPVMARISILADPCFEATSISLDDLKAAIVAKYPGAFDAQQKKAEADADFDWEARWPAHQRR